MTERVSKIVNHIVNNHKNERIYENMMSEFLNDVIGREINDTISWSTFKKYIKYDSYTEETEYEYEDSDFTEVYIIKGLK